MRKLAEKKGYKFPLIADKGGELSKAYNAWGKPIDYDTLKFELSIPTTYLINSDSQIVWVYNGTKTDRPKISEILDAIDTKL